MNDLLDSVKKAIDTQNWYAALFITLALPDICGKLENPDEVIQTRYVRWFSKYAPNYAGYISGEDCYALRCAILHEGSDKIINQRARQVLEHVIFLTDGPHNILFKDCFINGKIETFLQLSMSQFCLDICAGVEEWLKYVSSDQDIINRLDETVNIHEPGYVYGGVRFGCKLNSRSCHRNSYKT